MRMRFLELRKNKMASNITKNFEYPAYILNPDTLTQSPYVSSHIMNRELAKQLDSLERNLEEKIESSLALINDRLSKQDDRIITLKKKVVELDSSARFSNELIETQKKLYRQPFKSWYGTPERNQQTQK